MKRIWFTRLAILSMLSVASCATLLMPPQYKDSPSAIGTNPAATNVRVVEFLPSDERDSYKEVQMVHCALGGNGKAPDENVQSCANKMKNAAYPIGSSLVLVKPENKRVGQDTVISVWDGREMHCFNCVDMKGIILIPKTVKSAKK